MIPMGWTLALSATLFCIGVVGVLVRRNALVIFMSIELMLNAANLAFVGFARAWNSVDGHVFLVMEYIGGEDLASVLRRLGRPSRDKAIEMLKGR